ncbi:MAG: electron transfer flavoprotein subunit beta/FixA family protein [Desulfobacterales bacterium]
MKILVSVKRVPDPEMTVEIEPDGKGIDVSRIKYKANPFDEIALEEALRIREAEGGEVVIASIGPESAQFEIRGCLAMGADWAILVVTDSYLDPDSVARILVELVRSEKPDIVLMGKQASDSDDVQAPQLLAEYLGWGQACFASKINIEKGRAVVHREIDGGTEVVALNLPGVISADLRLNEPRYAKLQDILKAKKKDIIKLCASDLGIDIDPKVVVNRYAYPPKRKPGRIVTDVTELIAALKHEAKVI